MLLLFIGECQTAVFLFSIGSASVTGIWHVSAEWILVVSSAVDLADIYIIFFYLVRVAVDLFNSHLVYGSSKAMRTGGVFWEVVCLPNSFGTLQI